MKKTNPTTAVLGLVAFLTTLTPQAQADNPDRVQTEGVYMRSLHMRPDDDNNVNQHSGGAFRIYGDDHDRIYGTSSLDASLGGVGRDSGKAAWIGHLAFHGSLYGAHDQYLIWGSRPIEATPASLRSTPIQFGARFDNNHRMGATTLLFSPWDYYRDRTDNVSGRSVSAQLLTRQQLGRYIEFLVGGIGGMNYGMGRALASKLITESATQRQNVLVAPGLTQDGVGGYVAAVLGLKLKFGKSGWYIPVEGQVEDQFYGLKSYGFDRAPIPGKQNFNNLDVRAITGLGYEAR